MSFRRFRAGAVAVVALGFVLAGCSSDGDPTTTSGAGGSGAGATASSTVSTGTDGASTATSSATGPGSTATTSAAGATSSTSSASTASTTGSGAGGASSGAGGASSGAGGASSGAGGTLADAGTGTGGSSGSGGGSDAGAIGSDAGARATYVYVGGYGNTVSAYAFDPSTAALKPVGTSLRVQQVSFMAWSAPTHSVYALSETNPGRVFAFSTNAATGAIGALNDVPSGGAGPAHVTADPSGKWLLVANYDSNNAAVLPVQANGSAGTATADLQSFTAGTFPHEVALDPTERFAFVLLVGGDAIMQFLFDKTTGKLTANPTARVTSAGGPRHMVFHPSAKYAYVIHESASTMVAYSHDANGRLTEMQSESTRATTAGSNSTAEVGMHPSGKWLYGSNRGDSNIVQYAIGEADGRMTLVGHTDSGGATPRTLAIDPTGQFMFVGNQGANSIVVFRIGADGKLQRAGTPLVVAGSQPTCVVVGSTP